MKKGFIAYVVVSVLLIVWISGVLAFGNLSTDNGYVKSTAFIPKKANSTLYTLGAGRATTVSVPTTGSLLMKWKAFSATDGSAVTVKRSFDANTAYMPLSSEDSIGLERNVSNVVFTRYSGASTVTIGVDRN